LQEEKFTYEAVQLMIYIYNDVESSVGGALVAVRLGHIEKREGFFWNIDEAIYLLLVPRISTRVREL